MDHLIALRCKDWKFVVTTSPYETESLTAKVNAVNFYSRINLKLLDLTDKNDMKKFANEIFRYFPFREHNLKEYEIKEYKKNLFEIIDRMEPKKGKRGLLSSSFDMLKRRFYFERFIILYITRQDIRKMIMDEKIDYTLQLYIWLDECKRKRILEKIGVEFKHLLTFFEALYWENSLRLFEKKKCLFNDNASDELSKKDVESIRSSMMGAIYENDEIEHPNNFFNQIMSYHYDIENKINKNEYYSSSSSSSSIKKVYRYRHIQALEFAAVRKICKDIIDKNQRIIDKQKMHKDATIEPIRMEKVLEWACEANDNLIFFSLLKNFPENCD